jgi:hypothetical protein
VFFFRGSGHDWAHDSWSLYARSHGYHGTLRGDQVSPESAARQISSEILRQGVVALVTDADAVACGSLLDGSVPCMYGGQPTRCLRVLVEEALAGSVPTGEIAVLSPVTLELPRGECVFFLRQVGPGTWELLRMKAGAHASGNRRIPSLGVSLEALRDTIQALRADQPKTKEDRR